MLSIHKPLGQTLLKKPRIITKAIFYLKNDVIILVKFFKILRSISYHKIIPCKVCYTVINSGDQLEIGSLQLLNHRSCGLQCLTNCFL